MEELRSCTHCGAAATASRIPDDLTYNPDEFWEWDCGNSEKEPVLRLHYNRRRRKQKPATEAEDYRRGYDKAGCFDGEGVL